MAAVGSQPATGTSMSLRTRPEAWTEMTIEGMAKPALTVIGAWLVLGWNRFGPQALLNPRALTRFALVGIYAWLAMSLVLWAYHRWRNGSQASALDRVVKMVGLAHQPLLIAAFVVLVLQILPFTAPRTIVGVVAVVAWFPAQLVAATLSLPGRRSRADVLVALTLVLGWMATAGWYLWQRLGHVI